MASSSAFGRSDSAEPCGAVDAVASIFALRQERRRRAWRSGG
ncbi:hypothetical protein [Microbacterium enclense]|nr:hypothetical protein [Microbacterium enclense]